LFEADSGGTTLVTYAYDARGHRVSRTDSGATTDLYYSAAWQVLEERVGGSAKAQYVWSPVYVDALVLRDRDADADGSLEERLYAQQDANFNVTALVNASGTVVERFAYDPFGKQAVLDASGAADADGASDVGWDQGFQGMFLDAASGTYKSRVRTDYSPTLGRPITGDPIQFWAGDVNLYRWEGNGPANRVDPSGLEGYNPYSQHWHHLYPQQVFKGMATGVDINAAENGYILFAKDHIGEGGIHPKGWNADWAKWVQEQKDAGLPINRATMKAQLDKMMASDKYKDLFAQGKPAKACYTDWGKKYTKKLAALKAAKSGMAATSKKIPVVGIAVTIFFWNQDVQAKGAVGGTVNSALDAIPFVGLGKGIIELGTGDLIPDLEEIYDGSGDD
jgi:RHS repeat-associated protein